MLSIFARLDRLTHKHTATIGKIMLWGNAVCGLIAMFIGAHILMVIFLAGFLHELNQIEFAKVRKEIRAKRRWDEGQ